MHSFDSEAFGEVKKITIVLRKLIVKSRSLPFPESFKKAVNTKWRHFKQPG